MIVRYPILREAQIEKPGDKCPQVAEKGKILSASQSLHIFAVKSHSLVILCDC